MCFSLRCQQCFLLFPFGSVYRIIGCFFRFLIGWVIFNLQKIAVFVFGDFRKLRFFGGGIVKPRHLRNQCRLAVKIGAEPVFDAKRIFVEVLEAEMHASFHQFKLAVQSDLPHIFLRVGPRRIKIVIDFICCLANI